MKKILAFNCKMQPPNLRQSFVAMAMSLNFSPFGPGQVRGRLGKLMSDGSCYEAHPSLISSSAVFSFSSHLFFFARHCCRVLACLTNGHVNLLAIYDPSERLGRNYAAREHVPGWIGSSS